MAEVTAGSRSVELEQQVRQLSTALAGNRLTATAVGLVMARRRVDRAAASAWLVAESQRTGTEVVTVARDLVVRAERAAAGRHAG